MRALVVDGDGAALQSIALMLRASKFYVDTSASGQEGIELARLYEYDIIVAEAAFADCGSFEFIRRIRANRIETPILVLSGRADIDDKVMAFNAGADDYIVKPAHKDELIARIYAIIRRAAGYTSPSIAIGNLVLNLGTKTAKVDDYSVPLTGKEFQMLELMVMRKGITVSKEQFLSHLYGGMDEPQAKIIDVFLCKLRKKLNKFACTAVLETVWGRGYLLHDPVKASAAA